MVASCAPGRIMVCRARPKSWSKPCGAFRRRSATSHRCHLTAAGKRLKQKARRARRRVAKNAKRTKRGKKTRPKRARSSSSGGIASRIGRRRRIA